MTKKPPSPLLLALSGRLRAVQQEMGKSDRGMAAALGVGRTVWTNWVNSENFPEEEAMVRLCALSAVTMDWLYRGSAQGIAPGHAIRLIARTIGLDPDEATPPQMDAAAARMVASLR